MDLTSVLDVSRIAAALGVVSMALGFARRWWERHRWADYQKRVDHWLSASLDAEHKLNDQPESWWIVQSHELLIASGFSPMEVKDLGSLPVIFAKARAYEMFLIAEREGGTNGDQ